MEYSTPTEIHLSCPVSRGDTIFLIPVSIILGSPPGRSMFLHLRERPINFPISIPPYRQPVFSVIGTLIDLKHVL
jgi:hypothetical protein